MGLGPHEATREVQTAKWWNKTTILERNGGQSLLNVQNNWSKRPMEGTIRIKNSFNNNFIITFNNNVVKLQFGGRGCC